MAKIRKTTVLHDKISIPDMEHVMATAYNPIKIGRKLVNKDKVVWPILLVLMN
jgi:hypothetical protein